MKTMDNIEQKVIEIVAEKLNKDKSIITPESRFAEDLGADSLDIVEFMMATEVEYGIDISDEEAARIKTVADVIKYIKENQSQSA